MQKKLHPIRVMVIMFILLLLIILPPLFRLLFPKIEKSESSHNDIIEFLTCTRDYPTENITETVTTRYINSKVNQTKVVYAPLTTREQAVINQEETLLPSAELAFFQNVVGINIVQKENTTTITIDQNTIDQNKDNTELKENYFNDKKLTQKIYFSNRYFECKETTA